MEETKKTNEIENTKKPEDVIFEVLKKLSENNRWQVLGFAQCLQINNQPHN